jgi:stage V sporulation protein B
MTNTAAETTRKAGRGGLAIALAKLYFILVGLVQQIAFGRILGLDGYGALSSALSAASIVTNPITQASIQGVSREVSAAEVAEQPAVARRVLRYHALLGVVGAVTFFFLSRPLAAALGAPHIGLTLAVLSSILFFYGIYTPLVGVLNGQRRFLSQAGLDVLAATLRTLGLLGGAFLASRGLLGAVVDGSAGAALGFAVSAAIVLLVALGVVGLGQAGGQRPSPRAYANFLVPLLLGQALLNLLFQADGLLLRRFAAEAALSAGLDYRAADPFVGAYRAAQLFGFLPYQLLMSVTFVLFPMLSRAQASGDSEAVRGYVRAGVRLAVLLAGLMTSVLAAVPAGLIDLAYASEAADLGSGSLRVLSVGLGFLAVLGVMTSALNSLGGARDSFLSTALALLLVVVSCFVFVRGQPLDARLLARSAWATSGGLVVATVVSALLLYRRARAVVAPLTLLRVAVAALISSFVGARLGLSGFVGTLLSAALVTVLYLVLLALSRELGRADLARIGTIAGRSR